MDRSVLVAVPKLLFGSASGNAETLICEGHWDWEILSRFLGSERGARYDGRREG